MGSTSTAGAGGATRRQAGSTARVDAATLTADDGGNLTLSPTANQPISVKGAGKDGRYHVDVGGQDIAFTPEQMKRLNIKAGPGNAVTAEANLDVGFKVNGKAAGKAGAKGYDALARTAGDKYEARGTAAASGAGASKAGAAPRGDAHQAVHGNNWDSVGVPGQGKTGAADKKAAHADADKAQHKQDARKVEQEDPAREARNPEDEEKKVRKKKGKKVDSEHVVTPGESKVEVKDVPDGTLISFQEGMDLWKKMLENMSAGANARLQ